MTISEVQSLLENFDSISVQYTHRLCNVLAHSLAKLALERLETIVWMGSFPPPFAVLIFFCEMKAFSFQKKKKLVIHKCLCC